jgi:type I restriction enzyme S subunit
MTQRYIKYKDSGIEWIGEIPEHWEVRKVKYCLEIPITDGPHTTPVLYDEGIPFISAEAIKNGKINFDKKRGNISNLDYQLFCQKYTPRKYDIYMVKSGATTGNIAIVENDDIFNIWSPLAVFRANLIKSSPFFLFRVLESNYFKTGVQLSWSFGTQQNIGMGILSNLSITLPTLPEQEAIAQFLDEKCARIDEAVRIKEKQIDLLKEYRQIAIHQAVTKGLNDQVKMKYSGIDWIGEIPEHWEMKRLGRLGAFKKGGGFSRADLVDQDGLPAILYGDIYTQYDLKVISVVRRINEEAFSNGIILNFGELLFTGSGETKEDIGKCVAYLSAEKCVAGGDVIILSKVEENCLFLSYYLNTEGVKYEKAKTSKGEIIVHTYASKLKDILIPLPPLSEQTQIVAHLESLTTKTDEAIRLKEQQIEQLKQYKNSLINDVVTGKVRVA